METWARVYTFASLRTNSTSVRIGRPVMPLVPVYGWSVVLFITPAMSTCTPRQLLRHEFAQKRRCRARAAAVRFAQIVDVVAGVVGHLAAVVLEQRQTPDAVAGLGAGRLQQLPEARVVGERARNAIAECDLSSSVFVCVCVWCEVSICV